LPTYNTSGRYGLRALEGTNLVSDIDGGFAALRDDLDAIIATADKGIASSRPTSSPGTPGKTGRWWYSTDTDELSFDYGTGWLLVAAAAAVEKHISTSQTRVNQTSPGLLATPDEVTLTTTRANQYVELTYEASYSYVGSSGSGGVVLYVDGVAGKNFTGNDLGSPTLVNGDSGGLVITQGGVQDVAAIASGSRAAASISGLGASSSALRYFFPTAGAHTFSVAFWTSINGTITVSNRHMIARILNP
jgi:hypothetical protein